MRGWVTRLLLSFCSALPASSLAGGAHGIGEIKPLTASCLVHAANSYAVHPDVLLAILMVEQGTVGKNSRANSNGTYDIGPFQINSMHRQRLAALGISEEELRNDGCLNAAVAAWQLRQVLTPEKESRISSADEYLSAIANYHSATPKYNAVYAQRLRDAFARIYNDRTPRR